MPVSDLWRYFRPADSDRWRKYKDKTISKYPSLKDVFPLDRPGLLGWWYNSVYYKGVVTLGKILSDLFSKMKGSSTPSHLTSLDISSPVEEDQENSDMSLL